MGSFFAGIKAGTLSGVIYLGGLAIFNVGVLYLFKADTLSTLSQSFAQYCTSSAPTNSTISGSVEDCFTSVVTILIPIGAFIGFFLSLLYAGIFGLYFEYFPGRRASLRGETMGLVVGLNLLVFGLAGYFFSYEAAVLLNAFFLAWTAVYGYVLGTRYRKYTSMVSFSSTDEQSLRILVDGRDLTGKGRTFATTSTHKLRAEVADDASFKEWEPGGGVTVEDPRSFDTLVEVNGDGTLNALVSKKY